MEKILNNKIQHLAQEASNLSKVKVGLQIQLKEVDVRLTQIAGALVELQKIKEEFESD